MGPSTTIALSNIVDSGGIGPDRAECLTNGQTAHTSYQTSATIIPQSIDGNITNFSLRCRIVDQVGNIGPYTWMNGSVDRVQPVVTLPNPHTTNSITPTSMITATSIDSVMNGTSRLNFVFSGQSTSWNSTVYFNGTWNGTISSLSSSVGDGTLQVTLYGFDHLGNTATSISRTWTVNSTVSPTTIALNTSRPMYNVGNYVGKDIYFIGTPPAGSSFSATFRHSTGCTSGTLTTQNSTYSWGLTNICSGTVWLNVTTTDQYSRSRLDVYSYIVDAEVTSTPILTAHGEYGQVESQYYFGPGGKIQVGQIMEPSGVGIDYGECWWGNSSTSVTLQNETRITPNPNFVGSESFQLRCRLVDLVGNYGSFSWMNGSIDHTAPQVSVMPTNGGSIADTTTIHATSIDNVQNATSSLVLGWTNGTGNWTGAITFNGSWSGNISMLNPSLVDGTLTAYIVGRDWLGNTQQSAYRTWNFNTSKTPSTLTLNYSSGMKSHGIYVGGLVNFSITPPIGGSFSLKVTHSNGSILENMTTRKSTLQNYGYPNLPSGTIWANISTLDQYNRTIETSHRFDVDSEVTSFLSIYPSGTHIYHASTLYLGPSAGAGLSGLVDSNGVGYDYSECFWNGGSNSITPLQNTILMPPSNTSGLTSFTLRCRIVDLLSNRGGFSYLNGSVDLSPPTAVINPATLNTISPDTVITFRSTDSVLNGTSSAEVTWSNGTNSWNQTIQFNGSWSGSLSNLATDIESGFVNVTVVSTDWLGNSQNTTRASWLLNTTIISTSVVLDLSNAFNRSGNYVGSEIYLTATPPNGATFTYSFENGVTSIVSNVSSQISTALSIGFTNLSEGTVWFNVTTTDAFGRVINTSNRYFSDQGVNTLPLLSIAGLKSMVNGSTYVPISTQINVTNSSDDPGGSGLLKTECSQANSSFTPVTNGWVNFTGQSGQELTLVLRCRNVDRLGNIGGLRMLTVVLDGKSPVPTNIISTGSVLGRNSSIEYSCNDTVTSTKLKIHYMHQNSTDTQTGVLWLNGSQPRLSDMNLLVEGSLSLVYSCVDLFGNIGHQNTTGLWYTELAPYAEVTYSGTNVYYANSGQVYLGVDSEINLQFQSNNNGNGTVNSTIFSGSTPVLQYNTTNAGTINLSTLQSGIYRLETVSCSSLFCSTTQNIFLIDDTAPSSPVLMWDSNDSLVQSGQVHRIGRMSSFYPAQGTDGLAGISHMKCNTSSANYTTLTSGSIRFTPYLLGLTTDHSNEQLSCRNYDFVNNPSSWTNYSIKSDFTLPTVNLTLSTFDGVAAYDSIIKITCTDMNPGLTADITLSGTYPVTGHYSLLNGNPYNLSSLTSFNSTNQNIRVWGTCSDLHGNSKTISLGQFSYFATLGNVSTTSSYIVKNNSISYIGNLSEMYFSFDEQIGNAELRVFESGTLISSENISVAASSMISYQELKGIFANLSQGSIVSLSILHSINGSALNATTSLGSFERINAPEVNYIGQSHLSNGSSTKSEFTNTICPMVNVDVTAYMNGSAGSSQIQSPTQTVPKIFNITMPFSNHAHQIYSVELIDCVGNTNLEWHNLTRDISTPLIHIGGINSGIATTNRIITFSASDDSAFASLEVILSKNSSQVLVCSSLCSFYLPTDLSFSHNETGLLSAKVVTKSGQMVFQNISFMVDLLANAPSIDDSQSQNVSGSYIGRHSLIRIQADENMRQICANLLGQSDVTCVHNTTALDWTPPLYSVTHNISLFINATDQNGNSVISFLPFIYVHEAGTIILADYKLSSPQYVRINTTSLVPTTIQMSGDINQSSTNNSFLVNKEGRHLVNVTSFDALGYSHRISISIILDTVAPNQTSDLIGKSYIGYKTSLNLSAWGVHANVSSIHLIISNGQNTCSFQRASTSTGVNMSLPIDELFAPNCVLNKYTNFQATIEIHVQNEVGRTVIYNRSVPYFGDHAIGVLSGENYIENQNNLVHVSNHSTVWCISNHPIPTTVTQQAIGGNSSVNSQNQIEWESGNGIIRCDYVDAVGNTRNHTWVVVFVANDLMVNLTILNGSGAVTKFGTSNIGYQISGTAAFGNVTLDVDDVFTQKILHPQGQYSLNNSDGMHSILVSVTSKLGYTKNASITLWLDSQAPLLYSANGSDYRVDMTSGTIITPQQQVTIEFIHSDLMCGNSTTLTITGGAILTTSQQNSSVLIYSNSTQLEVTVTDCVGWKAVKTFTINRSFGTDAPVISNLSSIIETANQHLLLANNGTFVIRITSVLAHQITCTVDVGSVTCPSQSTNEWHVNLNMINRNATLRIDIQNSIGQSSTSTYTLTSDLSAPSCSTDAYYHNGVIYARSSTIISVLCDDEWAGLDFFTVIHDAFNQTEYEVQNVTVPLVDGMPLIIRSVDILGNTQVRTYNVVLDNTAPQISCSIEQNSLSEPIAVYLQSSANVECFATDTIPHRVEVSLILQTNNTSVELSNQSAFNTGVSIQVPLMPHETRLRLVIVTEDALGSSDTQTFNLEYDTAPPILNVVNLNHLGIDVQRKDIFAVNGTYELNILDTTRVTSTWQLRCESGATFNGTFESYARLFENYLQVLQCGNSAIVNVTAVDQASNLIYEEFLVGLDETYPQLSVISNELCPLDLKNITVLLQTSPLTFVGLDDSQSDVFVTIQTSGLYYEAQSNPLSINLSELPSNMEISIIVTLTDRVGHQTAEIIKIIIESELVLELTWESCVQANLSCTPDNALAYDKRVMGPVSLDIGIPTGRNQQTISDKYAYVCPLDRSSGCIEIESLPITIEFPSDGYWNFTYGGSDTLSRTYENTLILLVDTDHTEILLQESNYYATNGEYLICDVCTVTFILRVEHQPKVMTNTQNFTIEQTQSDEWLLILNLNDRSFPRSEQTMELEIETASGKVTTASHTVEFAGETTIEPYMNGTRCNDNPSELLKSTKNPDYLCTYSTNEINPITTSIQLELRLVSEHETIYSIGFRECFRSGNDNCTTSSHGPYSENSTLHDLKIKQNTDGIWMEYQITVYLDKEVEPRTFTVAFLDKTAFDSTILVDSQRSSVIVEENGWVEVEIKLIIEATLAGQEDLDTQSYLDLLKQRIESGTCRLSGETYDISITNLTPPQIREITTNDIDCKITATQDSQNRFTISSKMDWTNRSGIVAPDSGLGVFHLFQAKYFQIDYTQPIVERSAIPIQMTGESIQVKPTESQNDARYDATICEPILSSTMPYLEGKINSESLNECLKSITTQDGVYMVGISIKFETSSDDFEVKALCRGYLPATFMDDWLDEKELKENDKCQEFEMDRAATDQTYQKIKFSIIVCDLRCKMSAEYEGSETPNYILNSSDLQGFSVETQGKQISTPDASLVYIYIGTCALLAILALTTAMLLTNEKLRLSIALWKRRITEWQK